MRQRVTVYSGTLPPFALPTEAPAPVAPPVADPTEEPVADPTEAPVSPTDAPVSPTDAPVAPTDAPVAPTDAPVAPTDAPVSPTEAPVSPTDMPVAPSEAPVIPTDSPIAPSDAPVMPTDPPVTDAPTDDGETQSPTAAATTASPTPMASGTKNITLRGLNMEIFNIATFGFDTQSSWETTSAEYNMQYVNEQMAGVITGFTTFFNVTASTIVVPPTPAQEQGVRRGRTRGLKQRAGRELQEESSVKITYSQTLIYDTADTTLQSMDLATSPFDTEAKRDVYVEYLNTNSGNAQLSQVTSSTAVTQSSPIAPTVPPVPDPPSSPPSDGGDSSGGLSTAAIIGIACGGGALLILVAIYFCYCRKSGDSKKDMKESALTPPMNVSVHRDDDVSTLHDPHVAGGKANGHGDQSVATVDYDYSKAYGTGETSVSSAGGTFGSNGQSMLDPANAAATGAALGPGPFDDDGSFEAHFRTPGTNNKEEILHVFAPPGKLGVVIDTPDDGSPPLIHAVKENSVIYGRVQVGDKLVAVDDEDVRTMTAVKVSKLISRKSANPSRKLTIVRTTTID
ncbi:MAG: hypothetical protein SGILL_008633 [Bacillariaceae sp.]